MRGALRRLTARPVPLPVPSRLPHPSGVPPQVVRPLEPAWEAAYRAWQAEWNAWRTRSLPEAFARPAMLAPEQRNVEFRFEPLDLVTDRGGGHVQLVRSFGKGHVTRGSVKGTQGSQRRQAIRHIT